MKEKEVKRPTEEEINPIEALLDPQNDKNIKLFDENDKETEFEQIALIPLNNSVYAILKPVEKVEGIGEDEAVVFELVDDEENGDTLQLVMEEDVVNQVFEEYKKMVEAEEQDQAKKDKK